MEFARSIYSRSIISTGVMLLCFFTVGRGQNAFTIYNTANSGLNDNAVQGVYVDGQDRLWVATDNGLSRFDGTNWVLFDSSNSALPINYMRSVAEGLDGKMWVGTFGGGICSYDGTDFTTYSSFNSPMPDDHVRSLGIDSSGAIWVGSVAGLCKFDGDTTWEVYTIFNSIFLSNNISALFITGSDSLWAGTVNGGTVVRNDTSWVLYNNMNSGLHDNTTLGIGVEPSGRAWLSSPAGGLFEYNGTFIAHNVTNSSLPTNSLKALTLDNQQHVWTGSNDKGLIHYDGIDFEWFDSTNSPVPDIHVTCVYYQEDQNIIWAGTFNQGVVKIDLGLLSTWEANHPDRNSVLLFPNPVEDILKVKLNDPFCREVRLDLFDLTGSHVWSGFAPLQTGNGLFQLETIPAGFYLANLVQNGTVIYSAKLIKK
jgi:ligand-binding sensor domain-containing protein